MPQKSITLNAGSQRVERLKGKFLTVLSSAAPFQVVFDKGAAQDAQSGSKLGGAPFSKITFIETSGSADNPIVFNVGDAPVDVTDVRFSNVINKVEVIPQSAFLLADNATLASGNTATFSKSLKRPRTGPAVLYTYYNRFKIKIFHLGSANKLLLLDSNGDQFGQVLNSAESDWFETDDDFTIQASGGNVPYGVAQLCKFDHKSTV